MITSLANVISEDGKYLTTSCGYRGHLATQEMDVDDYDDDCDDD